MLRLRGACSCPVVPVAQPACSRSQQCPPTRAHSRTRCTFPPPSGLPLPINGEGAANEVCYPDNTDDNFEKSFHYYVGMDDSLCRLPDDNGILWVSAALRRAVLHCAVPHCAVSCVLCGPALCGRGAKGVRMGQAAACMRLHTTPPFPAAYRLALTHPLAADAPTLTPTALPQAKTRVTTIPDRGLCYVNNATLVAADGSGAGGVIQTVVNSVTLEGCCKVYEELVKSKPFKCGTKRCYTGTSESGPATRACDAACWAGSGVCEVCLPLALPPTA